MNCLLISGLSRNIERSYDNILKSIIEPNNPDIFIHTWYNKPIDPTLESLISKLYNPKKIVIEELRQWKNSTMNMDRMMESYAKPYNRDAFVNTIYSCWYSTQQANLLKEQYRLENDIAYNYAIRARFDINYSMPIDCSQYDNNILYLSNRDLPPEMLDDRFAFSSNEIINASYGSIFNFIDFVHSIRNQKDGIFCGETIIYEICRMANIKHKKIPELVCSHVR